MIPRQIEKQIDVRLQIHECLLYIYMTPKASWDQRQDLCKVTDGV